MPPVRADRDQLMQVVINHHSNAVKFCAPATGHVTVSAAIAAGHVELRIADNGPGIASKHHKIIFEKFRQASDSPTSKPAGSGLGLPISKRIIEHLGGRIWVESVPGRGATFAFTVPLAERAYAMDAAK
jgi:signal transduction histidine kinase